jgi:hypothetical protein
MIPLKRRDVVNADTQRWSPPAGMSLYLSASTILNPLRFMPELSGGRCGTTAWSTVWLASGYG